MKFDYSSKIKYLFYSAIIFIYPHLIVGTKLNKHVYLKEY